MHIIINYFLLALVAALDYATGAEVHLGCLYLLVVAVACWNLKPAAVVLYTAATVVVWTVAEWFSGVHYSNAWLSYWNVCNHIGVVAITAGMVTKAKLTLDERQRLIRELGQTLLKNRQFKELVPICRICHELRLDAEYKAALWEILKEGEAEKYIGGVCVSCLEARKERVKKISVEGYFRPDPS